MTSISWTDVTWNPLVGCSLESPGCTNCYAQRMAWRQEHGFGTPHYAGTTKKVNGKPVWTGQVNLAPEHILLAPLGWRKPRRVFMDSMSDIFHDSVPDEWIDRIFAVMALCPQHTFQVLTKRSERMREYATAVQAGARPITVHVNSIFFEGKESRIGRFERIGSPPFLPINNIWLGVSVEDQKRADERIPDLLATPAAVRFLSVEPMLGPVDLERWLWTRAGLGETMFERCANADRTRPDWVIVGAESGPGRRPFDEDWARAIRDQCQQAGTAFFYKQTIRDGVKIETPELDGRAWTEWPKGG